MLVWVDVSKQDKILYFFKAGLEAGLAALEVFFLEMSPGFLFERVDGFVFDHGKPPNLFVDQKGFFKVARLIGG